MDVYLIRDKSLGKERFDKIITTLNFRTDKKKSNSIKFVGICVDSNIDLDTMDKRSDEYILMTKCLLEGQVINPRNLRVFDNFFKICSNIRKRQRNIGLGDLCILLTNQLNDNNFFTWCDFNIRNVFIQTSNWDLFFGEDTPSDFPIMYEINAWVLRSITFKNLNEMKLSINRNFKGDIMDLCENKEQITLKMRSAYITDKLLNKLAEEKMDKYLQIKFVIDNLERVRLGILNREMCKLFHTPVHLNFTDDINNKHFISIKEFGNLNLGLDLSERVLYRLLLENEGEIHYENMHKLKGKIYNLYCCEVSTNRETETILTSIFNTYDISYTIEERNKYAIVLENENEDFVVTNIVNDRLQSFRQKISKINKTLKDKIPSGIVNDYLIISNENRYSINLDRSLVSYL